MLSNLSQKITQIFGATPTCEVDATTTTDTGPALVTEIHGQDSQGETQEQTAAADPSSGLAECGVQCSSEVKHTITATVGTQTDLCPEINPTFFKVVTYNASVQVDETFLLISGTFLMIIRILLKLYLTPSWTCNLHPKLLHFLDILIATTLKK